MDLTQVLGDLTRQSEYSWKRTRIPNDISSTNLVALFDLLVTSVTLSWPLWLSRDFPATPSYQPPPATFYADLSAPPAAATSSGGGGGVKKPRGRKRKKPTEKDDDEDEDGGESKDSSIDGCDVTQNKSSDATQKTQKPAEPKTATVDLNNYREFFRCVH